MADIDSEQEKTRAEVADYFRKFADQLDARETHADSMAASESRAANTPDAAQTRGAPASTAERRDSAADSETKQEPPHGDKITVIVGNESATINPPDTVRFNVEINSDSSMLSAGEDRSATFTLRWSEEDVQADEELSVE